MSLLNSQNSIIGRLSRIYKYSSFFDSLDQLDTYLSETEYSVSADELSVLAEEASWLKNEGVYKLNEGLADSLRAFAELRALLKQTQLKISALNEKADSYEAKAIQLLVKAEKGEVLQQEADRLATMALKKKADLLEELALYKKEENFLKETIENYKIKVELLKANLNRVKGRVGEIEKRIQTALKNKNNFQTDLHIIEEDLKSVDFEQDEFLTHSDLLNYDSIDAEIDKVLSNKKTLIEKQLSDLKNKIK